MNVIADMAPVFEMATTGFAEIAVMVAGHYGAEAFAAKVEAR